MQYSIKISILLLLSELYVLNIPFLFIFTLKLYSAKHKLFDLCRLKEKKGGGIVRLNNFDSCTLINKISWNYIMPDSILFSSGNNFLISLKTVRIINSYYYCISDKLFNLKIGHHSHCIYSVSIIFWKENINFLLIYDVKTVARTAYSNVYGIFTLCFVHDVKVSFSLHISFSFIFFIHNQEYVCNVDVSEHYFFILWFLTIKDVL